MAEARDNIPTVQRTEVKEVKNGFLGLSCDTQSSSQLASQQTQSFSKGDNHLLSSIECIDML